MIKISKKHSIISLAILAALIMALFPTTSFIGEPYVFDTHLKQQFYNTAGIFTVSPMEAAEYYAENTSNCYWIDLRENKEFKKSHLSPALNEDIKTLERSKWNPEDIILIYGNNTQEAQKAVSMLRQMANARAFAVEGGFNEVKEYLMDPIGINLTSRLTNKQLANLLELRGKISGEKVSPSQLLEKLKSSKSKAVHEGC